MKLKRFGLIAFLLYVYNVSIAEELSVKKVDRLLNIKMNSELRVCIWPDYYSITYRNPRTEILEGVDIEIAHAFAEFLEVDLVFVDSSFAMLVDNLSNDRCDIAMHGVGVREDRAQFMAFTQPHLRSGIFAVGRKNNSHIQSWEDIDQLGNIVVVQKGTYMEPVMRDQLQYAELTVVDDFMAREQEVMSGRADVFMTDYPYALRMVSLTQWARLIEPPTPLAPTDYAYAVPLNEDQWLKTVNHFMDEIRSKGLLLEFARKNGLEPIVLVD
ncbi:amino acid ABC transporter substrate-binding protein [Nitrincola tibetensis]|uniref:Amino acid ABC transporter substrate-binding protein n=1 Tax=Nitrincola tibetensis TaxID=2219697 RepID=A0A364NJG7_9GAMM|nr:ABC transporter substrate-binding protein [Nitrincola tibetensis]RAU17184.1 amino acid ABC transporter substrate-binding protein [Nitrincola tibetensis]